MNNSNFTLLIVDDLVENQFLLKRILSKEGFQILQARNGKEAIEITVSKMPDLILMDIMMPVMDGLVASKTIKSTAEISHIPIIFITALSDTDDIVRGFDAGGTDYISKPFNYIELLTRVKNTLALKNSSDLNRKYINELESLNQQNIKLFSIISHDIKNPLQGIIGLSEMLSENISMMDRDDISESANEILMSSTNLLKLLQNLLDWSRLQMNNININFQALSLPLLINSAIEPLSINAYQKNIEIQILPEADLQIFADKYTIETIIRNIISNAIKFTPRDGRVFIDYTEQNEYILLELSDTGIGMSEEKIKEIFKFSGANSQLGTENEEGTGLGLILCKEFIEKNNGTMEIKSELGKGTTFYLFLPKSN